jgi:SAM-dependent methyltransferase
MSQSKIPPPRERAPFQGTRQIISYNWPFYIAGLGTVAAGQLTLGAGRSPRWLRLLGTAAGVVTLFWTAASVAASWWVYDRSSIYQWKWLQELFPESPQRWANFHCGLDESTPSLHQLFPTENLWVFDIFNAEEMTEPAIHRARRQAPVPVPALPVNYRDLPLPAASLDAAFVLFAAHEIRSREGRQAFLLELNRVVRPGGRVVLLEHTRDAANFTAFGPGFLHFFSRRDWRELAGETDFYVEREEAMTPFVRLWVLQVPSGYEGSP